MIIDEHALEGLTDEDLVLMTLEQANNFTYLVRRYQAKLLGYIRRISGVSLEEAEDLLQEIFIKMYTHLNSFDTSLKFSSWAYRIAHNHVISSFRKRKSRPGELSLDADEQLVAKLASNFDLEVELDNLFLREHITSIFGKLDVKYREVLVLKYFEEKSYDEISDILKKPVGTIGTLINRAKKHFIQLYRDEQKQYA